MTHGFPSVSNPIFTKSEFQVENRPGNPRMDMMSMVKKHLDSSELMEALSDFHLLVFLHDSNLIDQVL
jgi:nuclear protein localization family protein 4